MNRRKKKRLLSVLILIFLCLSGGAYTYITDVADVVDAAYVADVADGADVADVADVADADDVADAADAADAADVTDVDDVADVADAADAANVANMADIAGSEETTIYAAYGATEGNSSLKAPAITVKASGIEGIKISWDKVSNGKKYEIYRATSKKGTYKKIRTTSSTVYKDKTVSQNKTYYYKVRAVSGSKKGSFSTIQSGKINTVVSLSSIPAYSGTPYVEINGNVPNFSQNMMTTEAIEVYSDLDQLGRCGIAYANVCKELMPTEERGSIGMIKPSGWHTVRYDDLISDRYLYNRCHLIGFQLTGENANEKNLITGTRYLNVEGMLPWENLIADYVKKTDHHVLYRVVPIFSGNDLVARGVQMEAYSVEDKGKGVSFNIFVYNVQPGITIDYATGDSSRTAE